MRILLGTIVLLLLAHIAVAEPVTYHFTGAVTELTGSLDLSGTFAVGAPISVDITVERSTPFEIIDAITQYRHSVVAFSFSIGSYVCSGSNRTVIRMYNAVGDAPEDDFDHFDYYAADLLAPTIGSAIASHFIVSLLDLDASAFESVALPRTMPPMTTFEVKGISLTVTDSGNLGQGIVYGSLDDVTTPVRGTSWGAIKGLYR